MRKSNRDLPKERGSITRWGAWNTRNLELLAESHKLYDGGPSPYALEYQRRYCCCVCKREIRQGCFFQASTGLRWCVGCAYRLGNPAKGGKEAGVS